MILEKTTWDYRNLEEKLRKNDQQATPARPRRLHCIRRQGERDNTKVADGICHLLSHVSLIFFLSHLSFYLIQILFAQLRLIKENQDITCISEYQRSCRSQTSLLFPSFSSSWQKMDGEHRAHESEDLSSVGLARNHYNDEAEMRIIMTNSRKSRSHPHSCGKGEEG